MRIFTLELLIGELLKLFSGMQIRLKPLLTENENEFFHRLVRALPDRHIFPQVAFNALLMTSHDMPARDRYMLRNRFDRKIADFVICQRER